MKFLIDECLSPQLAKMACARGHDESAHITWRGLTETKDWHLMPVIIEEDWTFVTKNSVDFRGRAEAPGRPGLHATAAIHAGLVCINGPPGMDLDMQRELFEVALNVLSDSTDLVNEVLEVTADHGDDQITVIRYALPRS